MSAFADLGYARRMLERMRAEGDKEGEKYWLNEYDEACRDAYTECREWEEE